MSEPTEPQQPYQPQPGYPPPPGYHYAQPEDPGAQTALITGILGLALGFTCLVGFFASPVAMVMGLRSKARIEASGGKLGGRGNAQAGFIMGLCGTILLGLMILAFVAFIGLIVLGVFASGEWFSNWDVETGTNV